MRTIVQTTDAPSSPHYSQAVKAGGFVFVSGMVGTDPHTDKLAGPTIREQATQALKNCEAILQAAGTSLQHVVEVQALLSRPEDFSGLNEAYAAFFSADPPARSVAKLGVEVSGVLVSIRLIAAAP